MLSLFVFVLFCFVSILFSLASAWIISNEFFSSSLTLSFVVSNLMLNLSSEF